MENQTEVLVESKKNQVNLIIDSSVLNAFEKCPTLMKYQYIDNLRLKGAKAKALEKGDLLHIPLKHYYAKKKEGMEWSEAVEFAKIKLLKYAPKLSLEPKEVTEVMTTFMSYCEFYQFERWEIVEIERPFRIIIYEDKDLRIILQGRIDLMVDTGQIIAPVDHKSESRRSEAVANSNQFLAYCYAAKSNNILINKIGFQSSLAASEKYYRTLLSYEDDNLEEWRDETVFKVRELMGYAEVNWFPHRYASCQDKYGKCVFHDVCHTHRAAREIRLMSQFEVTEPWSPFADLEDKE